VYHPEIRAARPLRIVEVDAGVVDQHVQPSDLLLKPGGELSNALVFGDVDCTGQDVETLPGELLRSRLGLPGVSRAEDHLHASSRELAARLEPDAAVGAGN